MVQEAPSVVRPKAAATAPLPDGLPTPPVSPQPAISLQPTKEPKERHFRIHYGATGFSYQSILAITWQRREDRCRTRYIRKHTRIINFALLRKLMRVGERSNRVVTKFESK